MRVFARSIVEGLNVVRNVLRCERAVFVDMLLDEFFLQTPEKGFRHGIIPTVTFATPEQVKIVVA